MIWTLIIAAVIAFALIFSWVVSLGTATRFNATFNRSAKEGESITECYLAALQNIAHHPPLCDLTGDEINRLCCVFSRFSDPAIPWKLINHAFKNNDLERLRDPYLQKIEDRLPPQANNNSSLADIKRPAPMCVVNKNLQSKKEIDRMQLKWLDAVTNYQAYWWDYDEGKRKGSGFIEYYCHHCHTNHIHNIYENGPIAACPATGEEEDLRPPEGSIVLSK